MSNELRLFSDAETNHPVSKINFGRIKIGTTKTETIWMKNMSKEWPLENIISKNTDSQITINFKKRLEKNSVQKVDITWKPSLSRREVLDMEELFEAELVIG